MGNYRCLIRHFHCHSRFHSRCQCWHGHCRCHSDFQDCSCHWCCHSGCQYYRHLHAVKLRRQTHLCTYSRGTLHKGYRTLSKCVLAMTVSSCNRRLTVSISVEVASIGVTVIIAISRTCISSKQSQDSSGLAAGRTSRLFLTECHRLRAPRYYCHI